MAEDEGGRPPRRKHRRGRAGARGLPSYVPDQELDFPYLRRFGPPPGELFARLASGGVSRVVVDGRGGVLLVPAEGAWNDADCVADYYTEFVRVRSRVLGGRTVLEVWISERQRLLQQAQQALQPPAPPLPPPRSWGSLSRERLLLWRLREAVYDRAAGGQCTNFRPSFVKCFLEWCGSWRRFRGAPRLRVLDPCAGWGDRLVGSIAAGVAAYTAVDPNPKVHEGYRDLLLGGELFQAEEAPSGAVLARAPGGVVEVDLHQVPFEDFDPRGRRFHVVLTSPPFGPREVYWAPGSRSQADQMAGPPGADEASWAAWWYREWLMPALSRMASMLEDEGVIALYAADCRCLPGFCEAVARHLQEREGLSLLEVVQCGRMHRKPLWVYGRRRGGRDDAAGPGSEKRTRAAAGATISFRKPPMAMTGNLQLALILLAFVVLCLLSRMASDASGVVGSGLTDCVRASARDLLRCADVSLEEANQDGLAAIALGHSIEARVYAHAARAVLQACGRSDPELISRALDIENAAHEAEDTFLDSLVSSVSPAPPPPPPLSMALES